MLDHADAGHRVERVVVQLAVVGHPDLHAVLEPALAHALLGHRRLRLGEGDAEHPHVVALGGVDREAPPAAAHVEHALPGAEVELAADHVELLLLRLLQRGRAAGEERAAVGELLAEEQREELGRKVVVVADRPGVAPDAVALAARAQLGGGHRRRAHRADRRGRRPGPGGRAWRGRSAAASTRRAAGSPHRGRRARAPRTRRRGPGRAARARAAGARRRPSSERGRWWRRGWWRERGCRPRARARTAARAGPPRARCAAWPCCPRLSRPPSAPGARG